MNGIKTLDAESSPRIAVVIPAYRSKPQILDVVSNIEPFVTNIYVIDDSCPDRTGSYVKANCPDHRVRVITHPENLGVGGATKTGYLAAIEDEMDVILKIDGDGQMDPKLIRFFVEPILRGQADYCKGNRFYDLDSLKSMPLARKVGNTALSFLAKISSGYWNIFDPTNGYTAIHCGVVRNLPLSKISNRYFFENDMLFRLGTYRAVVVDIPMEAKYGDEKSNLKIHAITHEFFIKLIRNTGKRIFYNYYLRDMSIASFQLPIGLILLIFGTVFGVIHWQLSEYSGTPATAGTVMLSALPIIIGLQFLLNFLAYDIAQVPSKPISKYYLRKLNI